MADAARDFCLHLLDRAGIPLGDTDSPFALRVHDERLWDRVVAERNLGLGEAYMDGW